MRLLIDMNLSPRWVRFLLSEGFEAAHWASLGPADASDSEIMAFARANDLVVVTRDLDFGTILAATGGEKPSVVQIRADRADPHAIGGIVAAALSQLHAKLSDVALVTIDSNRTRLRLLPLR